MNLQTFIVKYDGKFVEVTGSVGAENQCVDLANAYLREVLNHEIVRWTNAKDFPSKLPDFTWYENTPEAIPQPGDLMIWQHNQWGHIAILVDGGLNSFHSFDQNYPTGTPAHIQPHNYTLPKVAGWLRPPESESMPTDLEACMDDRLKFWKERDAALAEVDKLEDDIERLNVDKKSLEDDVRELNFEVERLAEELKECQNSGTSVKIDAEVEVAGQIWEINGVEVGSDGLIVGNYKVKES